MSAADNDINKVGIPNCRIIAIKSFLFCSKYGGLERIFLNILYPSLYFTISCFVSLLSNIFGVIVLPLLWFLRNAKDTCW